jgi:hypothetical protein
MGERHIRRLERRRDYLIAQIAVWEGRGQRHDYARSEKAALDWALGAIEDANAIGLERIGELTLAEREELRAAIAGCHAAA